MIIADEDLMTPTELRQKDREGPEILRINGR